MIYKGAILPSDNKTCVGYISEAEDLQLAQVVELLFGVKTLGAPADALVEHKRQCIRALSNETHQFSSEQEFGSPSGSGAS